MPVVEGLPVIDSADNDLLDILRVGKGLNGCLWECPFGSDDAVPLVEQDEEPHDATSDSVITDDEDEDDEDNEDNEDEGPSGSDADSGEPQQVAELEELEENKDFKMDRDVTTIDVSDSDESDSMISIPEGDEVRTVVLENGVSEQPDSPEDIDSLTYGALKTLCRQYGLVTRGKKAVLQQRLRTYFDNL